MLTEMTTVLLDSPTNTTEKVQVTARAVAGLTQRSDELSPAAQVQCITVVQHVQNPANAILNYWMKSTYKCPVVQET